MTIERVVELHLVKRVKALGGEIRKVQWIGRRGAPDRFVMLPAPAAGAWVELKRPGGRAEAHQLREHERLRRYGQVVLVLDSVAAVDRWLDA